VLTDRIAEMEAEANAYRAKAERRIDELSASLQRERVELAVAQGALETTRRDYMRLQRDILAGRSPQQTGPNLEVVSDRPRSRRRLKTAKAPAAARQQRRDRRPARRSPTPRDS
jgi:hypothetical protein